MGGWWQGCWKLVLFLNIRLQLTCWPTFRYEGKILWRPLRPPALKQVVLCFGGLFVFSCDMFSYQFKGWANRQLIYLFFVYLYRICIITLAESHPILQQGRKIKSIDYRISDGCSRLNNKVSGKSKRVSPFPTAVPCFTVTANIYILHYISFIDGFLQGGQFLTEFAPLCRITCTDDIEYTICR